MAFHQGLNCLTNSIQNEDRYDMKIDMIKVNEHTIIGALVFNGTRPYRLNVTVVIAIPQLVQYPNKSVKEGHPTQEVNGIRRENDPLTSLGWSTTFLTESVLHSDELLFKITLYVFFTIGVAVQNT